MKNSTKCILTVLITYIAECIVSYGTVTLVAVFGKDDWLLVVGSAVIGIIFSVEGAIIARQPKCVWISFSVTVLIAWFIAILSAVILDPIMFSVVGMNEIVNIVTLIIGYPGFMCAMMLGEYFGLTSTALTILIYTLSGMVPVIVTVASVVHNVVHNKKTA